MSETILQEVETLVVNVKNFLTGVAKAIIPVLEIENPGLGAEAQFLVDTLNAWVPHADAPDQPTYKATISYVMANPAKATQILQAIGLKNVNLGEISKIVAEAGVVSKSVQDVVNLAHETQKSTQHSPEEVCGNN